MGQLDTHIRVKLVSSLNRTGEDVFTSSQTFTVPNGVTSIQVFVVGAGGGTHKTVIYSDGGYHFPGGGGGGYTNTCGLAVSPGDNISISIGSGVTASNGGDTVVGSITAKGGYVSKGGNGGNGGSGGGAGEGHASENVVYNSGAMPGGSDGGDGLRAGTWYTYPRGGIGQGTTTRAFGESEGTLYSTGGYGSGWFTSGSNGAENTGNGGSNGTNLIGGSGIAIIRWGN